MYPTSSKTLSRPLFTMLITSYQKQKWLYRGSLIDASFTASCCRLRNGPRGLCALYFPLPINRPIKSGPRVPRMQSSFSPQLFFSPVGSASLAVRSWDVVSTTSSSLKDSHFGESPLPASTFHTRFLRSSCSSHKAHFQVPVSYFSLLGFVSS